MALQGKTAQVSAERSQSIDTLLSALFSELESLPAGAEEHVGYTAREAAEKWGISEGCAQRYLSNAVRAGKVECGSGYRYSPVMRREYRTVVYWSKD